MTKTETIRKTCAKHGEYTAKSFFFPNTNLMFSSGCPKCEKEEEEKARKRERELKARKEALRLQEALQAAGLKKRELEYSFEGFLPLDEMKREALATARRFASSRKLAEAGATLIFHGSLGTGKTHLAAAITRQLVSRRVRCRYATASEVYREYRNTFRKESRETEIECLERLSTYEVLILDEIGLQGGSDAEIRVFSEIVDNRHRNKVSTVLCSNMSLSGIAGFLGARTWSRIQPTMISQELEGKDLRQEENIKI
jgi:DNA replication protein DnaC